MEESFDSHRALSLLNQFGISPDQLSSQRLEEITKLSRYLSDPSKMTPKIASKVMKMLGVRVGDIKPKTGKKIGPNEKCPCKSNKKYKKCCGRPSTN